MTALSFKSAAELAADIKAKKVGCAELLEHYLDRVETHNPKLNALVVRDYEKARARARQADEALARGEDWGPLHGVPMSIKESYNLAGTPTTWGVPALKDNLAPANAVAVDRLLGAGAVIFGKTNVPLLLGDFQSYNEIYGTTGNPWDPERTPGGSSGGSAAMLAAGLTGFDIGSDIGGSVRNPAHYCGVYGHKPTWGIVATRGHAPTPTVSMVDLSVLGPMARSAGDLAIGLEAVAGPDMTQADGWKLDLSAGPANGAKGLRVGLWLSDEICPVDSEVAERVQGAADALARAGARIDDKARPSLDARKAFDTYRMLLYAVMTSRQPQEAFEKAKAEAAKLDPDDHSDNALVLRATVMHHRDWMGLNESRNQLRLVWKEFFKDYDVLLTPMCASTAFPHDHNPQMGERRIIVNNAEQPYFQQLFWAGMFTLAYLPATVAPAGLGSRSGLPVGVQIVGPEFGDRTTIAVAGMLAAEIGGFTPPPGYD